MPKTINETESSITKEVILCRSWDEGMNQAQEHGCTKAFRVTEQELDFYKRFNIPIPEYCPNSRMAGRTKYRNGINLWHRTCMCDKKHPNHEGKCEVEFETSYGPDRPEIVYCEKCYQQEVY